MFIWLLGTLGAAIVLSYFPLGEQLHRRLSLGLCVAAAVLTGYVATELWNTSAPFGYADMWMGSATTITALVFIVASYVLIHVVAYQRLERDHLDGPMSLTRLRHHLAALHGITLAAVVASMSNNLWLAFGGLTIASLIILAATGFSRRKIIGWGVIVLGLLAVLFGFMTSSTVAWDQLTFSRLLATSENSSQLVLAAWVLAMFVLGSLSGLAPFGNIVEHTTKSASMLLRAMSRSVLAISATFILLRLTFVADVALGDQIQTGAVFLAIGLITAVWALATRFKQPDDSEARFGFLAANTAFVAGLGPAGLIVVIFLLASRVTLAPLCAVVEQGGRVKHWSRAIVLSIIGLPVATCFIAYVILVGYGLQLFPWLTLAMLGLIIAWSVAELVRLPTFEHPEGSHALTLLDKTALGLVSLQVVISLAAITPDAIALGVSAIAQLTNAL